MPIFVPALHNCEPILDQAVATRLDPNVQGQSAILCSGTIEKTNFNAHSGVIKSGLCHLAIPRGWSWGGPASPFCPIWAELKVPDWPGLVTVQYNRNSFVYCATTALVLVLQFLFALFLLGPWSGHIGFCHVWRQFCCSMFSLLFHRRRRSDWLSPSAA